MARRNFDLTGMLSGLTGLIPFLVIGGAGYLVYQASKKGVFGTLKNFIFGEGAKAVNLGSGKVSIPAGLPGRMVTNEVALLYAGQFYNALDGFFINSSLMNNLYNLLNGNPKLTLQVSNAFGRRLCDSRRFGSD